jgi:hypothetical protein
MKLFSMLALALGLVMATVSPILATTATIETTAPLRDHAKESIKTALLTAVKTAFTGAVAMGLPWVRINQTLVSDDAVVVQILATDTEPQTGRGGQTPGTDTQPGPDVDQLSESEL